VNPLLALREVGQSVWLDYLRRGLLTGGGLERLIREDGLSGVTSNPTIFGKAIGGSTDYDEAVRALSRRERSPRDVFYELALEDVRAAADLFLPRYEETEGGDGFVSFELEADLAHDAGGSVEAALDLFRRIDRPNTMIKVPGTKEGVQAAEELTAAALNVNVTLLFSVDVYEQFALAYVAGLERRLDAGQPLDRIASVASFFVSRVDSAVDARLPEGSPLRGRVAVANARVAYERFRVIFSGERWERLAAAGARVQRPLWASTSTKNPAYRDVLYVEELVGPDTVNTIPQSTIDAFRDHGVVRPEAVTEGVEDARETLAGLAELGIDLDEVTATLLDEGLAAFDRDFAALLETIDTKLAGARAGASRPPAPLEEAVTERLRRMDQDRVVLRMWRKDHTVWKPEPREITDRLGWLTVADAMHERLFELESFARQAVEDGLTHAVLMGMGGSSLAPEVLRTTFGVGAGALDLIVLDTTHPAAIAETEASLPLDQTLFLVASKSGTTVETLSHLAYFWDKVGRGEQFVAITDPGTPLEKLGRDRGFRAVFLNPEDIGGRYSALSLFGLVPGALIGADLHRLLDGAEEMACACDSCVPIDHNPGVVLGATMGEAALAGRDKLTLVLPAKIASFGDWVEQLVAESTGKEGKGILPVVGEGLGPPDVYGTDRLFVALGDHDGLDALDAAGLPVVRLPHDGPVGLGREFFRFEFATASAGHVLSINPFDQPNVAEAKGATKEILEGGPAAEPANDDPEELLASLRPGDYVAIQAYLAPAPDLTEELRRMRLSIRDRHRVATTVGFGPRFLHSTGQLHKGGPPTGAFIQVVEERRDVDLPIPGAPYTFGALIDAQALGDLRSLRQRGRRVARVTLDRLVEATG
jgi:transaldolase/glucose-6-phosphate isomerase